MLEDDRGVARLLWGCLCGEPVQSMGTAGQASQCGMSQSAPAATLDCARQA